MHVLQAARIFVKHGRAPYVYMPNRLPRSPILVHVSSLDRRLHSVYDLIPFRYGKVYRSYS
jgi:hypothetical protein